MDSHVRRHRKNCWKKLNNQRRKNAMFTWQRMKNVSCVHINVENSNQETSLINKFCFFNGTASKNNNILYEKEKKKTFTRKTHKMFKRWEKQNVAHFFSTHFNVSNVQQQIRPKCINSKSCSKCVHNILHAPGAKVHSEREGERKRERTKRNAPMNINTNISWHRWCQTKIKTLITVGNTEQTNNDKNINTQHACGFKNWRVRIVVNVFFFLNFSVVSFVSKWIENVKFSESQPWSFVKSIYSNTMAILMWSKCSVFVIRFREWEIGFYLKIDYYYTRIGIAMRLYFWNNTFTFFRLLLLFLLRNVPEAGNLENDSFLFRNRRRRRKTDLSIAMKLMRVIGSSSLCFSIDRLRITVFRCATISK